MSYFPEDIPFMSKEELRENGIRIPKDVTDTNVGNNSEIPNSSKGHWIFVHPLQEDDTGAYMCSECKVGNWEIDPERDFICPNCGADMRGKQNEVRTP